MIEDLSDQLTALLRNLTVQWDELRSIWDDSVRREFEESYIEPLQGQIEGIHGVMGLLGHAVEHARAVIEDR